MSQTQNKNDTLLCTFADCKNPQQEDGEYCTTHTNMNTYTINWEREDYGHIEISANSIEEAREKFEQGNYKDVDLNIKGGGMNIYDIEKEEKIIAQENVICTNCKKKTRFCECKDDEQNKSNCEHDEPYWKYSAKCSKCDAILI